MNEIERNQIYRYDLQDTRPRLTSLSDSGTRIIIALNILFVGVLAALTYAAVQVFDGWHHAIVIADMGTRSPRDRFLDRVHAHAG